MAITHAWHDIVADMKDEMHDLTDIGHATADRQAYLAMWATFTALPLLFGLDKLAGFMNTNWEGFYASWVNSAVPGSASDATMYFGVLEVAIAAAVFFAPRIGGDVLAAWLVILSISVFSVGGMAYLGFGTLALAFCALAMARLSTTYHHKNA
jgi:hypothetical protein